LTIRLRFENSWKKHQALKQIMPEIFHSSLMFQ
jgi:hypothetical protein